MGSQTLIVDYEAERIAAQINLHGYGTLPDFVSEDELQPLRTIARTSVQRSEGETAYVAGLDALGETVVGALARSAPFNELFQRLCELATGKAAPAADFHIVLRCLQGATGQAHSNIFHYDRHLLTALLPVDIPQEGPRGDLLIIPHSRPIRRLYLSNVLDKALIGNRVAQAILRNAALRKRMGVIAVPMRPGTIYFFFGYRSIHTNEPCRPDKLRATALFHYGDPHRNSRLPLLMNMLQTNRAD